MMHWNKSCVLSLLFLVLFNKAYAHLPVYTTVTPSKSNTTTVFFIDINGVNNKDNAAINNNSYADVFTTIGDAWLQLKYSSALNAGSTTFLRVESLSYSLASLINDDLTVDVYNNATAASNGTLVASPTVSIVQDQNYTYLAVTPTVQYNSVRINLSAQSITLPYYVLRVYYGFYNQSDVADCGSGWAGNIGEATAGAKATSTVQNPNRANDQNQSTYSTLNLATQQKDIIVSQTVYFSTSSYSTDLAQLKLSVSSAISSSYTITIQAYNGSNAVGAAIGSAAPTITSLLNAQVNTPVNVSITPGAVFDRVKISITIGNNGNTTGHVNIHDVQLVPAAPTFQQGNFNVCAGNVTFQVSNPPAGIEYHWYNNNTIIPGALLSSYTANVSGAGSPYTFRVAAVRAGCTTESAKDDATVTVNTPPTPYISTN